MVSRSGCNGHLELAFSNGGQGVDGEAQKLDGYMDLVLQHHGWPFERIKASIWSIGGC